MNTNKFANLIRAGISQKTLMDLNESEISTLHKTLIESKIRNEATTVNTQVKKYSSSEVQDLKNKGESLPGGSTVKMNGDGSVDITEDGELGEAKKKANPFAICTSQLGKEFKTKHRSMWSPKEKEKYERCVRDIKKSPQNENKLPIDVLIENKLVSLLEKYVNPKMKKGDIVNLVNKKGGSMKSSGSAATETAPAKPKTSPGTKPKTSPGKPKEDNPYSPKVAPAPKAGSKKESNEQTTAPAKPKTSPGTKPKTNPGKPKEDNPYSPKVAPAPKASKKESNEQTIAPSKPKTSPGIKPRTSPGKPERDSPYSPKTAPAPKARKPMPSWMSFDSLGLKFKK